MTVEDRYELLAKAVALLGHLVKHAVARHEGNLHAGKECRQGHRGKNADYKRNVCFQNMLIMIIDLFSRANHPKV